MLVQYILLALRYFLMLLIAAVCFYFLITRLPKLRLLTLWHYYTLMVILVLICLATTILHDTVTYFYAVAETVTISLHSFCLQITVMCFLVK